ncbi:hypothetical protein CMI44_01785 [Candidatus Pacearchaeota archaeon]|jgi:hypothetical protein|nr:hypothetical protein [Candidatus Pacearchaeota archaeon]|tara:strand:+ start:268 stop:558 length:291 start_codon:yes stop_codon:yes gene_type:complete
MDKKSGGEGVKKDSGMIGYVFGIISIVMAFFQPIMGIVFGIIGIIQCGKQENALSKKAKRLSKIGIILSIIFFILSIAITYYFATKGINLGNFPIR